MHRDTCLQRETEVYIYAYVSSYIYIYIYIHMCIHIYVYKGHASAAGPFFIHWWQIGWRRGLLMHVFDENLRFRV